MMQRDGIISRRLEVIEQEIYDLECERALWISLGPKLVERDGLLKEGDKLTARFAGKFKVLALVAEYLGGEDCLLYGGASTRELYQHVEQEVSEADAVNYNTFRSHMARFLREGRLYYNSETHRWRVGRDELTVSEENVDEEYEEYRASKAT
ncbi:MULTISPECIES: hypothetical protein [unclassified Phaeobacter]|uniref:hypothetical protein n=1 Tax=unclassified Phaeobacter TaxID=2621772 RepID=UPI003A8401CF